MVVLFELVAYRRDDYVGGTDNLEECDITRAIKRNDQFAQKGAPAGLAAREGRGDGAAERRVNLTRCHNTTRKRKFFGGFYVG